MRKTTLAAALVLGALAGVFAADLPTRELTSNNIYGFAGNGDTLWMVTDQGLNCTIANSDTLSWLGYKAPLSVLSLGFGGGVAVACIDTAPFAKTGKLWYYSYAVHSFDSIPLPFKPDSLSKSKRDSSVFKGVGVTWAGGFFWLACVDGGLVRWNPAGQTMRAFYPKSRNSVDPAAVRLDSATTGITAFPDPSKRVIAVSVGDSAGGAGALFVCTPAALYRFHPNDTSWDTLPGRIASGTASFAAYLDVFSCARSKLLYASVATAGGSGSRDTILYRYDSASGGWITYPFLSNVTSLTFGPDSVVYFSVKPNNIQAAAGSRPDTLVRTATDTLVCSPKSFLNDRMSPAMDGNTPDYVTDVLYLPYSDITGSLWIGTASSGVINNGLFFTRDERAGERGKIPFVYVHRERAIQGGLKQTYAYPGILNGDYSQQTRTIFAYSLSKASKVTIAVYDWNMSLVKNIITNEDRKAGKDDPLGNGRSTDRTRDFWDGTNNAGKRVAVGVYYFRITAQDGERSFGKIIVAK
ncbi:MAG TPA: hypothetical protein VKF42_10435 [Chitinivibrionales bacterium]|jgi:hypothetical protein|nr:hypothetical protein [Chitinivibrionales bacterium]